MGEALPTASPRSVFLYRPTECYFLVEIILQIIAPYNREISSCHLSPFRPYFSTLADQRLIAAHRLRFSIQRYLFPLTPVLHLSKLCVYINYVYSGVPWCCFPSTVSMRTSCYEVGQTIGAPQRIPWRETSRFRMFQRRRG